MKTEDLISRLEKQGFKVYSDGTIQDYIDFSLQFLRARRRKDVKEQTKIIKNQIKNQKIYRVWWQKSLFGVYTGRELHNKLKYWLKNNIGGGIKHFQNARNRRKNRDLINSNQFDKIPSTKPTHYEDPWGWD